MVPQAGQLNWITSAIGGSWNARASCQIGSDLSIFVTASRNFNLSEKPLELPPSGNDNAARHVRKIIHIDMDCFYAAIEERENPALRGKPVGVGGSERRGVLTTANYEARKYGCRSAMPVFKALELCPHLILVPVQFDLYRAVSSQIRSIFSRFTDLIEPLSLDEAYLDVSHLQTDGAAIAREIRAQIFEETRLTASAGIAPNKLIAKIASDWHKPNGQKQVREDEIPAFMAALPVGRIWGVGKKMREKLSALGIETCADLQALDQIELARRFGKWGIELWQLCRGIDDRPVSSDRTRKSVSSETTFRENIETLPALLSPDARHDRRAAGGPREIPCRPRHPLARRETQVRRLRPDHRGEGRAYRGPRHLRGTSHRGLETRKQPRRPFVRRGRPFRGSQGNRAAGVLLLVFSGAQGRDRHSGRSGG